MTEATAVTRRIILPPDLNHLALVGRHDEHLRDLETRFDVRITARGHDVTMRGEESQVDAAERVLRELVEMLRARPSLAASEIGVSEILVNRVTPPGPRCALCDGRRRV